MRCRRQAGRAADTDRQIARYSPTARAVRISAGAAALRGDDGASGHEQRHRNGRGLPPRARAGSGDPLRRRLEPLGSLTEPRRQRRCLGGAVHISCKRKERVLRKCRRLPAPCAWGRASTHPPTPATSPPSEACSDWVSTASESFPTPRRRMIRPSRGRPRRSGSIRPTAADQVVPSSCSNGRQSHRSLPQPSWSPPGKTSAWQPPPKQAQFDAAATGSSSAPPRHTRRAFAYEYCAVKLGGAALPRSVEPHHPS